MHFSFHVIELWPENDEQFAGTFIRKFASAECCLVPCLQLFSSPYRQFLMLLPDLSHHLLLLSTEHSSALTLEYFKQEKKQVAIATFVPEVSSSLVYTTQMLPMEG